MKKPIEKRCMKLCCLGHPLLDIISHVDSDYLARYNIELGSCNLATSDQLSIFEDLSQRRDAEFVPGGASMNSVRVAKWMLGQDGANSCFYVGSLGDDEFGCILERTLNKPGVRSYFQIQEESQTGTCACVIVDKERSLVANLSAALEITMSYVLSPEVQSVIDACDVFYFEGFFLNTVSSPENTIYIGKHCCERNKTFCYNLSAPYLCHIFKDRWAEVLPYVDIVFGSRIDAMALAEAFEWYEGEEEKTLDSVMIRILELPKHNTQKARIVVVTDGSESTLVATVNGVSKYSIQPLAIEDIVDTNGAGDAFVGGFLSQFMLYEPIEKCVNAGHLAAAAIIQQNGCQFFGDPPKVPEI